MTDPPNSPTPAFSVVIGTYNRPVWLREAVASVLAQDVDVECVVVDDGGTVELDVPCDPRVRVIRHEQNRGLAAALNTGLDACRGEFVTFLDDDDRFAPGRLSSTVDAVGRADVVICWHARIEGDVPRAWNKRWEGNVYDTILDSWAPAKGALVMRRADVPRFDTDYLALEDLEWLLRVTQDRTVTTVARVGYLVRQHATARHLNGPLARVHFGERLLEDRRDYFTTHRAAAAFRWYMLGCLAMQLGDRGYARRAFVRSFSRNPNPRRLANYALAIGRSTHVIRADE